MKSPTTERPKANSPDVLVRNEGTVFVFCPLSAEAKEWIDEHVQPDAQWFGNSLSADHHQVPGERFSTKRPDTFTQTVPSTNFKPLAVRGGPYM